MTDGIDVEESVEEDVEDALKKALAPPTTY
jgi:hypothetical protein